MAMVDTMDIENKFATLHEYEAFSYEWAKACYLLNPTEKNKERLERSKRALAVLKLQNEAERSSDGAHD